MGADKPKGDKVAAQTRHSILEMAHQYAQRGEIYRATDRYLKLMRAYPNTQEGQEAREAILKIAERYGAEGKRYHALSLYNKLAAFAAEKSVVGEEKIPVWDKETIKAVVRRYTEEIWGAIMGEGARKTGVDRGAMDEVPFVDLRGEVHVKHNFERLGRVQRSRVDITRAVNALRELKG